MKFIALILIAINSLSVMAQMQTVTPEQIWEDQKKKHEIEEPKKSKKKNSSSSMNTVTAEQIWEDQRKKHGLPKNPTTTEQAKEVLTMLVNFPDHRAECVECGLDMAELVSQQKRLEFDNKESDKVISETMKKSSQLDESELAQLVLLKMSILSNDITLLKISNQMEKLKKKSREGENSGSDCSQTVSTSGKEISIEKDSAISIKEKRSGTATQQ